MSPGPRYAEVQHLDLRGRAQHVLRAIKASGLRATVRVNPRSGWMTFSVKIDAPIEHVSYEKEVAQRDAELRYPWLTRASAAQVIWVIERVRAIVDRYNWSQSKPEEDYFNEAIPYSCRVLGNNGKDFIR